MRRVLPLLIAVAVGGGNAHGAEPAAYPARPIRLVVPFAPGGAVDVPARLLGAKMSELAQQQVVIDNRGGAGGVVGTELVARAAGDGYTLLLHSATIAYEPALRAKLPYDALKDLAPISITGATPNLLVVHPAFFARSARDLVQLAKQKPGAVNFGTGGVGSSSHLAVELFRNLAGVTFNHVPYKGAGPALIEVIAGQIDFMIATMPSAVPHVRSARVRALGISTLKRSAELPEVPTIAESGVANFDVTMWYGVLAAAGTPQPLVMKLHGAVNRALRAPEINERLLAEGSEPSGILPDEFSAFIKNELTRWAPVIRASGAKAD